ncbi:MAG: hypothetical protein WCG27_00550 [Pseudomonadota bacterium]
MKIVILLFLFILSIPCSSWATQLRQNFIPVECNDAFLAGIDRLDFARERNLPNVSWQNLVQNEWQAMTTRPALRDGGIIRQNFGFSAAGALDLSQQLSGFQSAYGVGANIPLCFSPLEWAFYPVNQAGFLANVPFAGEKANTIIRVMGHPYRYTGEWVVNLSMINDREQSNLDYLLTPMRFDDYYSLMEKVYQGRLKIGQWVLWPISEKGERQVFSTFQAWKIKKLDLDSGDVELENGRGRQQTVGIKDLFFYNAAINPSDMALFSEFFQAGGLGRVIINRNLGPNEYQFRGAYLHIGQMPVTYHKKILKDQKVWARAVDLLPQINLLLAANNHDFIGLFNASKSSTWFGAEESEERLISSPMITLTPEMDFPILAHEEQHWADSNHAGLHAYGNWIKNTAHPFIPLAFFETFFHLPAEQRAIVSELAEAKKIPGSNIKKRIAYLIADIKRVQEALRQMEGLPGGEVFRREFLARLKLLFLDSAELSYEKLFGPIRP